MRLPIAFSLKVLKWVTMSALWTPEGSYDRADCEGEADLEKAIVLLERELFGLVADMQSAYSPTAEDAQNGGLQGQGNLLSFLTI